MSIVKKIDNYRVIFSTDNITIKDSYLMQYKHVRSFCEKLREASPFEYKRTVDSWERELFAHILMHRWQLFTDRTTDTDIDENEKLYRRIGYWILFKWCKWIDWLKALFEVDEWEN